LASDLFERFFERSRAVSFTSLMATYSAIPVEANLVSANTRKTSSRSRSRANVTNLQRAWYPRQPPVNTSGLSDRRSMPSYSNARDGEHPFGSIKQWNV
jgi:hypothetical protein